jgi:hypothetical protein
MNELMIARQAIVSFRVFLNFLSQPALRKNGVSPDVLLRNLQIQGLQTFGKPGRLRELLPLRS